LYYASTAQDSNGIYSPNPEPIPSVLPQFQPGLSFSNIIQSWNLNNNASGYDFDGYGSVSARDGLYGTPAFFNNKLYVGANGDSIKAYQLVNGKFTTDENGVVMAVDQSVFQFSWPGVTPSISADPTSGLGIVWVVDVGYANNRNGAQEEAILNAYKADNLGNGLLYNSELSAQYTNNPMEHAGPAVKYASPTVYNGKVYFATKTSVEVYGLIAGGKPVAPNVPTPPAPPTGGANINLTYDASTEAQQGCQVFTPSNQYQFVIQPCGGIYPACETSTSIAGGAQGALEQFALIPVSSTVTQQVLLAPGQYEMLPATNSIPNNGGFTSAQGIATIFTDQVPFTFVVPTSGFINVSVPFYCGLATTIAAIPAKVINVGPPQRYSPPTTH
jgi:hypothetical protein